ncbi:MAG: DUF4129 domain-containing protein [Arachnia sp.]
MDDRGRGRGAVVVAGAALVLAVAALGASSGWGHVFTELPHDPAPIPTPPPPSPSESVTPPPNPFDDLPAMEPARIPSWIFDLITVLAVAAVAALIAWLAVVFFRALRKPGLDRAAAAAGTAVEIPEIDEEEVALSLQETLARLRSGMPVDDAVVECWRRLEAIAADSGIVRAPTQTSEEFTVAILAHAVVDDASLSQLAALYRRAMFSAQVLTDADRDVAIGCVERLAAQLGASDVG